MTIAIIDYGMGNVASIANMLKELDLEVVVTNKPKEISNAKRLILPGVGSFDQGVEKLRSIPFLIESIMESISTKRTPLLGICLGMQLLMEKSEEGILPGLGLVPGKVVKFGSDEYKPSIHMGWNTTQLAQSNNGLSKDFTSSMRFYFVHGYFVKPTNIHHVLATTKFGDDFCSMLNAENLWGVQFHPEKSHRFGRVLLRNFGDLTC